MGQYSVLEIIVYPIKSCKGVSVPQACVSTTGFQFDREWMVVTADKGRVIGQAAAPKLASVTPSLPLGVSKGQQPSSYDVLEVNAPGMHTLKVPLKAWSQTGKVGQGERGSFVDVMVSTWTGKGMDEGPQAAAWWTAYLGRSARFVRLYPARVDRQVKYAPDGYVTGFSNTGQFHIISEGSHQELNRRLRDPLPMNRFRPNMIVRGPPPFEEDKWRVFSILHRGKKVVFTFVEGCARNKVPTINQENPEANGEEPLKTLATFRSGEALGLRRAAGKQIFFGSYFVCEETLQAKSASSLSPPAAVAVGDAILVTDFAST